MAVHTITGDAVRCVLKAEAIVGESPLWHGGDQRLYWVQIMHQLVNRFDPVTGTNETFKTPEIVTCLGFRKSGGLVLTTRKNFALFDPATGRFEYLQSVERDLPDNRFNDGRADRQGRFWAGTMNQKNWNKADGNLYRLDPDQTVRLMHANIACVNGTDWSPDNRTMYTTETFNYTIWAHDFDPATGGISNRRAFVVVDKPAFPDGLTVDSEGFVWSNHVGAGKVVRYDPAGKIERVVQLPVPRAVACTFGGPDLRTLFVSSARENMSPKELAAAPLSGSLFAVDAGVSGLPAAVFAG
jgi:sugar lactone lactonase YvrE